MGNEASDNGSISCHQVTHHPAFAGLGAFAPGFWCPQQQVRQHRGQEQGKNQRAQHGHGHSVGEGAEGFSLYPLQGEQGEEYENDDDDGEDDGTADFHAGAGYDLDASFVRCGLAQDAVHVFDHDNGAVHHHADGDGQAAEGHEVGREAEVVHAEGSKQH